jgi:hypothetical protein
METLYDRERELTASVHLGEMLKAAAGGICWPETKASAQKPLAPKARLLMGALACKVSWLICNFLLRTLLQMDLFEGDTGKPGSARTGLVCIGQSVCKSLTREIQPPIQQEHHSESERPGRFC